MEIQAKVEDSRRQEYAKKKLEELRLEWAEQEAAMDRGEAVADNGFTVYKLLAANQAVETGQDFDELVAITEARIQFT
jgi:hypothetical protein